MHNQHSHVITCETCRNQNKGKKEIKATKEKIQQRQTLCNRPSGVIRRKKAEVRKKQETPNSTFYYHLSSEVHTLLSLLPSPSSLSSSSPSVTGVVTTCFRSRKCTRGRNAPRSIRHCRRLRRRHRGWWEVPNSRGLLRLRRSIRV